MAVKDQDVYHHTEALILANPRRHYRATIGTVHWQLRSLISAEGHNIVYYPSGAGNLHIQRLDTDTRETETVSTLPFMPRCLVAKNGWICSGGETGEFVAIDLNEDASAPGITADDAALEQALDSNPDASQLLEHANDLLGSLRVRHSIRSLANAHKSITGKSKQFGKERVNCITLWFPPTLLEPFEGAYKEPVAVLANNDKSVAIVCLRSQELFVEIEYPDCVNRAVCSPDGRLLVAVSDDPYLYIYEQTRVNRHMEEALEATYNATYRWTQRNKIHLISQRRDDRSDNRGSFAACFSSTGRYLAVGTQYGSISLFDTATITDPDVVSLITSFTSSRPNDTLGAVRAMEFAPGPVDLLAWTEDRGRVGIADMRNGCISRQIIHLDKDDDYDHISLTDRGSIDPRLLETRRNTSSSSRLDSTSNADLAEISRQLAVERIERINQPLNAEETRVLEALQEHSRRAALRSQRPPTSFSPSPANRPPPPTTTTTGAEVARLQEGHAAVSGAVNDMLGHMRHLRAQREQLEMRRQYMGQPSSGSSANPSASGRERDRDALWSSDRDANDALRRLIGARGAATGSSSSSSSVAISRSPGARRAREQLQARTLAGGDGAAGGGSSTAAWSELEALWSLSFDNPTGTSGAGAGAGAGTGTGTGTTTTGGSFDPTPVPPMNLRSATDNPDARRRERAAFLLREWDVGGAPGARRAGAASMAGFARHAAADPYDTAGLSWSEDGRTLFVGAERGIYELHVNMLNRKFVPTNEPR